MYTCASILRPSQFFNDELNTVEIKYKKTNRLFPWIFRYIQFAKLCTKVSLTLPYL
jgi:hypothetical protein